MNLSALLRGMALDVYSSLLQDKDIDCANLNVALLKRFERTENGFRQQFCKCRPEKVKTFAQFKVRLAGYLDRWIELRKVSKTFEGLYNDIT